MKKLLAFIFIMICLVNFSNASAPPLTNNVSLFAQHLVAPNGSQIIIPVKVKDFQSILSLQGSIQYDTTILQFVDVQQFGLAGMNSGSFGHSLNKVSFLWFDNSLNGISLADSATVFAIRFNVIGNPGQISPILFTNTPTIIEAIQNDAGNWITLNTTLTNGSLTVQTNQVVGSFKMMADTISVLPSSQVTVPIRAKYFNHILTLQGTLQFDPSVMTFSSIQYGLPGMNTTNFGTTLASAGKITYIWSDPAFAGYSAPDSSVLFSVLFNVIGSPGNFSNLSFIDVPTIREVVDSSYSAIAAAYTNGKVSVINTSTPSSLTLKIDSINAPYNSEVLVPVRVKGFNNILTMQGTISFDPTKVAFIKTEQFGLTGMDSLSFGYAQTSAGKLSFSWNSVSGQTIANDSVIFSIRFLPIGLPGTETPLTFTNSPTSLEFSDGNFNIVTANFISGLVYILPNSSIVTGTLSSTNICAGSSLNVPYTAINLFYPGNIFSAQLSDYNGNYGSYTTIGSVASTTSGTISATIPSNMPYGTNYRIRVISSNPSIIGSDNGADISIFPKPGTPTTPSGAISLCSNPANTTYWVNAVNDAISYSWTLTPSNAGTVIGNDTLISIDWNNTFVGNATLSVHSINSICVGDESQALAINIISPSVGGIATAISPICSGNTTTISVASYTGNIQWQQSPNGSSSWINVVGGSGATSSTYTTPSLSTTTFYRAVLTNGICSSAYSVIDTVLVNTPSIGGTAIAISPICSGSASIISLSGNTGSIQWQQSPNGSSLWTNVSGGSGSTTSSYSTPSLSSTTYYRAVVTNGTCASSFSVIDTVIINAPSVGGTATALSPICSGSTSTISLTAYTGTIQWQQSSDGITSWANVSGGSGATTATYSTPTLPTTTFYRAIVTNGACSSSISILDTVVVNTPSVGGIATAISPICSGNTSTVSLSVYTGSIQWQQSPNGTSSWINVSGGSGATSNSYTTSVLSSTTFYRAIVTNGACTSVFSITDTITVLPTPIGGTATAISPVCSGSTSSISLTAYLGNIQWQQSPNGSSLWTDVTGGSGANTAIYNTPSIFSTTFYRAVVSNGVCPSVYSSIDTVIMNSPSVGGIATAISPICSGSTTTITLTAYTGTIQWQQSLDGLTSWANVIGGSGATGTIYTTPALSTTTFYRAIVTNGACTFATSVLDTVIVNTASVGGTATAISPICSGNTSTITLSGNSGTIQWQQSPNGISSWTNVIGGSGANSITYSTPTLSSTTYYRATVTNGVCASAFSVSDTIVVNALSVGGTATANSPICSGSTSTITLSANTGTIQWQQSPDGINSWANVTGGSGATTSIYTTPALFTSTYYRAIVANGVCSSAISVIDTVVVNATSVGGVATALSPICLGNTSSISLVGNTGNIQWQQSPDGTTSWTNVSGGSGSTSSIYITPSLINTTYYRAIVTNGVCPSTNSALDTVTVNAPSLGGIATALSPICSGNTSTVTLAGYTGTIQWQSSNDGTTSWTNVVGGNGSTTNTYSTPPLLTSTYYRAIVTNGVCPSATSILDTIVVNSLSVGGITTSTSPICSGNSSTVTLSAYTGSIQWQQSPNGTSSWINVSGGSGATAITYTTSSLSSTTFYRAIVTNGACIGVYSEIDTIIVLPVPVGGFATAISPVCIGSTSTVTLSGFTGNIQWQQSPNGSTLWNDVSGGSGANTTSYTTPSLLSLTYYRALVSNGVCPSVYSSIDTVIISPLSVGGGANAASPICAGNTTVVTLNGFTGNIQWQQSPDGTSSWTNVTGGSGANSASYTTPPLNITTFYQAVITSGACASVISSIDNVMVLSVPIGGIATSNSPVCSGSVSTISLTGYSGNIQWQQSPNGTSLWTDVTGGSGANTSTYTSPALTTLIYYRAILSNAACSANSTVDTVLIDAQSLGGIATTISPVCEGFSSSVSLTGYTGNIQWQQSPDGTSSWVNVIGGSGVTNSTYQTAPLNVITYYRAIVTNGACSSANSNSDSIMVNPISVGGVANAVSPICSGNTSTISLSGFSGTIQWQQSPNNTTSWTNVSGGSGANNSTYTTPILTTTTYFRAIITSGVCPSDSSISDTLLVNPLPVVSFTIPLQHDTVCFEEPAFILTGGNPLNGTYSGTGVSSGSFDPAIAGIGTHILTYAYTNPATTCSASATQTIEEISCIGIKEIEKSQISIYPNPFEDEFFFNISSSKNVEVELFNSIGKLIKSLTLFDNLSENYCIKMCSYSQGFYYLKFHFKDEVKTYKILKIK